MKRYVALCVAAAMVLSLSGCTAVKKYEVDEDDLAYSRTLYPDGEYPDDYYEDEDLFEEDEIGKDYEETEHGVEDNKKDEKKEDKDKKESKSEKNESSKQNSNVSSSSSSSSASSKPSSSKSSSSSKTRTKWIKSLGAGSSKPTGGSDTDSDKKGTDSDGGVSSYFTPKKREPIYMGEFRLIDLSYNAEKDYLDFNDKEDFVRDVMGEPLEESVSEDAEFKYLTYEDCIITLKHAQETEAEEENTDEEKEEEYFLINILVPYESYYETFKFISTSFYASNVLDAYGEPTEIVAAADDESDQDMTPRIDDMPVPLFFPDEDEQTDSENDTETDTNSDESTEVETEQPSDSELESTIESEPESKKPFTGDYLYKRGSKALIFHIENDEIMQIEYRWDR